MVGSSICLGNFSSGMSSKRLSSNESIIANATAVPEGALADFTPRRAAWRLRTPDYAILSERDRGGTSAAVRGTGRTTA